MDEHTILPPLLAVALIFTINVLAMIAAVITSRRQKRFRWLPYALLAAWLLTSIFVLAFLSLADISPERNGPLPQEVLLLPVAAQFVVTLISYVFVLISIVAKRTATRLARSRKFG